MKLNSRDLSSFNRCTIRRNHNEITTKSAKGNSYNKAVLVKSIIKESLINKLSSQEIKEKLIEGFKEINYLSEETKRIHVEETHRQIMRYLSWEKREPYFPENKEINIFGIDVSISPDVCFITDKYVEIVKYKIGKPNITKKGRKLDYSVNNNLELYAMMCLASEIAEKHNINHVKSSFYFLRKTDESHKDNVFDPYFDNIKGKESNNMVSLEYYSDEEKLFLDAHFKELYEDFKKGQIGCENCEYCDFYNICNYKHAVKTVKKKKEIKSLNDIQPSIPQNEAINFEKGVCRINAGAGAGKTFVISARTAMLKFKGEKSEEIALFTFTDEGAREMRERIQFYLKDYGVDNDMDKLTITTFNAFGNTILQKMHKVLGYPNPPKIIDEIKKREIITQIINNNPVISDLDYFNFDANMIACKGVLPTIIRAFDVIKIYQLKNDIDSINTFSSKMNESRYYFDCVADYPQIYNMFKQYNKIIKQKDMIEYADQELAILELLKINPFYFDDYGIKHIIVDEFQDSSDTQIEIIRKLCDTPSFKSLMVVGDDSQSIYGFRDTTPENIINFYEKINKQGIDINLLENHRSTPEIINFANEINNRNKNKINKQLIATRPHGKSVEAHGFRSSTVEYQYIAEQIEEKIKNGENPGNIAFIARTRNELLSLGSVLTSKDIPWILLVPEPLLENSKVIAAIELAKAFSQSETTEGILTYLNALLKNTLLEKSDVEINEMINNLRELITENIDNRDYFEKMLESINDNDEVYEYFMELLKNEETLKDAIHYAVSFETYGQGMTYKRKQSYPGVILTTAHSSKGLEFPIVFNSISKYDEKELHLPKNIEETRRLFFVSATRAKDELYITSKWYIGGNKQCRIWNRYLKEVFNILNIYFPKTDEEIPN